jgi:DNA-binding transcriptional ArsR family regulator
MDISVMQRNADEAAGLLKTLANPSRLLVLCALVTREHTAGELEEIVGLSQSAVSQHLARLRSEHLVNTRRQGQNIYYSLSNDKARQILGKMHEIYCADID